MSVLIEPKYLNVACGGIFTDNLDWGNVDYTSDSCGQAGRMNVLHGLNPWQAQY